MTLHTTAMPAAVRILLLPPILYSCLIVTGYAIKDSRNEGYCKNEKWLGLLKDCLDCALKYEIWQWYGDKVGAAAKACGLDATPVDPNAGGDSTSEAPQPQTSAPGGQPTEKPTDKPAPEPTSSAHEGGNTQAHTDANTGAHTTPVASTPGAVETDKPAHTTAAPKPTGGHGANSVSLLVIEVRLKPRSTN